MARYLILILTLFTLTDVLALNRVQYIDRALGQSIDSQLYDVAQSGRYIKISIDRSLQASYKDHLHKWINETSKVDKNFERIHLNWRQESVVLSQLSQNSLISMSLLLAGLLFSALIFLSRRDEYAYLDTEERIRLAVEKKVEQSFMDYKL